MSTGTCLAGACTCGCCEPPATVTPEAVENRPHLSSVDYRVGTYATFRQAMIQLVPVLGRELARENGLSDRPLQRWTSRDTDDHGITMIEMWATIADILTFYQERYANEAWLRTAVGRDAIRRLAGLIGYELSPGLAAETYVAYTLDDGVDLELRAGLRAQSVPREGETPQVFETMSSLSARSRLNRVAVHGEPLTITQPFAAGRTSFTLRPDSERPNVGDSVVLFTPGGAIEQRTVRALDEHDGRTIVHWSRPLDAGHTQAFVKRRSWRLFGHQAPSTFTISTPAGSGSFLTWSTQTTDFTDVGSQVILDSTVDGLEAGGLVLVDDDGHARRRTIVGTQSVTATRGPVTGSATRIDLSSTVDVHAQQCVVHELGARLRPQTWELPTGTIPITDTLYVPTREAGAVEGGRRLLVADASGDPFVAVVAEDAAGFDPGSGEDEFLAVRLAAPTPRTLDAATAYALGNVVLATHGETVAGEVLGNGDASSRFQVFTLAKVPLTHVRDVRAPGGARSTLAVDVDRVRWGEVDDLFGAAPHDRVYATTMHDDGEVSVEFGDGDLGSLLPTGRANVVATYRKGIGRAGNVTAAQITTALDKPTGLSEVVNPLSATGGVDPEDIEDARDNAPNTVRTFDRAIALRDFAHLARDMALVGKAISTWVWDGEERVVFVTVGSVDGSPLGDDLADVIAYVDARRDPNRSVRIAEFRPVEFAVEIEITCAPERYQDDVEAGVRAAIESYFAYDRREFAQAVHLSDLYAVVHAVDGVDAARVTRLRYRDWIERVRHGAGLGQVLTHAPVFGARRWSGGTQPAELATLDPDDLAVVVSGGLVEEVTS